MFRKAILTILFFVISGCTSTDSILKSDALTKGNSKQTVRDAYLYASMGDDPFLCDECKAYYSDLSLELFANENKTNFVLFEGVTVPFRGYDSKGNGRLVAVFNSSKEADAFIEEQKLKAEHKRTEQKAQTQKDRLIADNESVIPNAHLNREHEYYVARNILLKHFSFSSDPLAKLAEDKRMYYELLYNQIYDDLNIFSGFNWNVVFVEGYVKKREERPSWDWSDQVKQLSYDNQMMGSHNYIRQARELVQKWGKGYAMFLKSSEYVAYQDFDVIRKTLKARSSACFQFVQNIPPSKRPTNLFCRGFSTTGLVLKLEIDDYQP